MKLLFFIALTALFAPAQNQDGAISGTVVDAITHQPIKRAMINANGRGSNPMSFRQTGTSTDANGAFTITGLAPGNWVLNATHQSYPNPNHKTAEVKAGETTGSVTIELIPGAVASGRVLDEDGDPLQGCFVSVHPAAHPEQQRNGASTDDTGEFRVHNLPAGRFIFSVQCHQAVFVPRPFSAGPDPPPSLAYPVQYYPLVPDAASAQAVTIAAGAEKSGIDFRMRPAAVTQIHGSLSPAGADWHGEPNLVLQLFPASPSGPQTGPQVFDREKGTFEFRQVFPGSYYLTAFTNGDFEKRVSAVERVEVKDRPIETVLTLTHGVDLKGVVTIEDNNSQHPISLAGIQLQIMPDHPLGMGMNPATIAEDGTFTFKSVPAGRWRLGIFGPPIFIKSAWLGPTEITNSAFEVSAGAETLRVVASTKLATLTGSADPDEYIFAVPDDNPQFGARGFTADPTGHFSISGLAPGRYRVGAMEQGAPFPDEGGQIVTLHEGETVTIEIKPRTTQ